MMSWLIFCQQLFVPNMLFMSCPFMSGLMFLNSHHTSMHTVTSWCSAAGNVYWCCANGVQMVLSGTCWWCCCLPLHCFQNSVPAASTLLWSETVVRHSCPSCQQHLQQHKRLCTQAAWFMCIVPGGNQLAHIASYSQIQDTIFNQSVHATHEQPLQPVLNFRVAPALV